MNSDLATIGDADIVADATVRAQAFFGISMSGEDLDKAAVIELGRASELGLTLEEYRFYKPQLGLWKEIRQGFRLFQERINLAVADDRDSLPIMPLWKEDLGTRTRRGFLGRSIQEVILDYRALKVPLVAKALDSLELFASCKVRLEPEIAEFWKVVKDGPEAAYIEGNFPSWIRGRRGEPSHCLAIRILIE